MLNAAMQRPNLGDGDNARLSPLSPKFETETSVAALMARSAPSSVSTVLWNASDAAERQALLDAVQSGAVSEQSGQPVTREPDAATAASSPASSSPGSSGQFLSMLDTVTYPAEQIAELLTGNDQGSGKGGVSFGDIDAINDSLSSQSFSAPDSRVTSALSKAGVAFQTNANGSIYVPSAGGYAVHASTGLGSPISQVLAGSGGGRTQASGTTMASNGLAGAASSAPAASAPNEIIVTAQSRPSSSSGGASFGVNPFAAISVSSPQSNGDLTGAPGSKSAPAATNEIIVTAQSRPSSNGSGASFGVNPFSSTSVSSPQATANTATPTDAPEIVVTAKRDNRPEPFVVETRSTISRSQLDRWWVEFSYQTSTLGPRSDDTAIRQSFADAYARVTEGELEAKAVAIDVVTTAIIAPAGAALVAVAAPVIAGAAFAEGTVLYYTTAATIGGTGNMLVNEGTHRLTSDAPVTTGERLGSIASGMIFGGQFVIRGLGPVANNAASGGLGALTGNFVQQKIDTGGYDLVQGGVASVIGTAAGAAGGAIGNTAVPGVTVGRGNWAATYQGVSTRIANGNALTMSAGVAGRGGAANQANQVWSNAVAASVTVLVTPRGDEARPKQ